MATVQFSHPTDQQPTADSRRVVPAAVTQTMRCVAVVAIVHLVALTLLLAYRDTIVSTVAARNPALTAAQVAQVARSVVLQSAVPHVVLAVVLLWRARALVSRRARSRGILTAVLTLQILAHATLPITVHQLPSFAAAVIAVQATSLVFEVSALVLLWRSAAVRAWFRPVPDPRA